MNKISCVYKITSKISGKVYIGSSVNFHRRKTGHFKDLRENKHENPHLQNHYNKYGESDLTIEILEIVEPIREEILSREQYYIDFYDAVGVGFNIAPVAGSRLGVKVSEESKMKMSESKKGTLLSEETKQKISDALTGVPKPLRTEEHKQKLGIPQRGHKRWLGRHHEEESKQKISAAKIGNTNMLGKTHSDESKEKMRNAKLGTIRSDEVREKISNSLIGNKRGEGNHHTDEARERIGKASKGAKWVNKDGKNKRIFEKDFSQFIEDGWIFGKV